MAERLEIDIARQQLWLVADGRVQRRYGISSAAKGVGEAMGSGCTPRGLHRIRIKVGAGCAPGSVFVGRRLTGEIYCAALAEQNPGRDWILTRILWLTGIEPGRNRGGQVDTLRRHIYIHGCPDTQPMGVPRSHGCIRMADTDLLDLFERVRNGTLVDIRESFERPG